MSFQDLLARIQQQPQDADYHSLRMAYARSPEYAPYVHDLEGVERLRDALQSGDLEAALLAVGRLLSFNYLDIEAHMAADYVYTMQGDTDRSTYHRTVARGLIDAINDTGDGNSPETAYIVLNIPEEYTFMRLLGYTPGQQTLVTRDEHEFDMFDVEDPEGQTRQIYFNIDLPRQWLEGQM
ncbi:MAG TPA: DUF4919 domain-containing protein [Aggregatilinea sp.]|uniref:DUF4919 domain-containing protein n=1 Tax=Aggregatilinea sp. TaxID=2806333 RepID=UPI002C5155F1|nr:DUF4919 domain-containing protein [Aggregatilinea sp.]HML24111.1 DUF4919 domain-containing protein [Aggregatilinea sp.]